MAEAAMNDSRLTGQVAFHSQQTIEKYFKAYLTEFDFAFPKIHDLLKLYDFVKTVKDWNIDDKLLEELYGSRNESMKISTSLGATVKIPFVFSAGFETKFAVNTNTSSQQSSSKKYFYSQVRSYLYTDEDHFDSFMLPSVGGIGLFPFFAFINNPF